MKMILNILTFIVLMSTSVFSQTENEIKMVNLVNQVRQTPNSNPVAVALDSTIKSTEKKIDSFSKKLTFVSNTTFKVTKNTTDTVAIKKQINNLKDYLKHLYNTKDFLKNVSPVNTLVFDKTMYDSYKNYDMSKTKGMKHTDVFKKAENMVSSEKDPVIALMNLIVDFPYAVGEKYHRSTIFNSNFTKISVVQNTTSLSEVTYIQGFK